MALRGNPYAAPQADLLDDKAIWRDGHRVMLLRGCTAMPLRCFKCNEALQGRVRKWRLFRFRRWTLAVPLLCLLLVIILRKADGPAQLAGQLVSLSLLVPFLFRQRLSLTAGFCKRHLWQWRGRRALVYLGGLLVFAVLGHYMYIKQEAPSGIVIGGILSWCVWAVWMIRPPLRLVHMDAQTVALRGCGEAFVASLPPAPDPKAD